MKLNYLQDIVVLPASVLSTVSDADPAWVRVLLWLASDLSLAEKPKQLAKLADCDVKNVKAALQFWSSHGVLADENGIAAPDALPVMGRAAHESDGKEAESASKKTVLRRADTLPQYTATELGDLLEKRANVRILVDEAQRILGKMFHPAETNLLVGMLDYLEMSEECILLLLAHCKRIGKTNMRSIEKYACNLAEKGILEASAMEEELRTLEELHSFEGEIRTLYGLKSRALSAKESKMLRAWVSYGYGIEIVRRAFEETVNATGEASLPYTNAILERWHNEGLQTLEQIDQSISDRKAKKDTATQSTLGNSFDTDAFFEAALRRGLSNKHED